MNLKQKKTLGQMVGKQIQNVIYAESESVKRLYLCFTDGTHAEVYSGIDIRISTRLHKGTAEDIKRGLDRGSATYEVR